MNTYNNDKINIRPELKGLLNDEMTKDERFQNVTLRPILKMQHELINLLIQIHIKNKKSVFYDLSLERRPTYIKKDILGDPKIIHGLRGLVIGLFTVDELIYYLENKGAINKRIQALLYQRVCSIFV